MKTNKYRSTKNLIKLLSALMILALTTQSCIERIDIKTETEFQKLTVEGFVTNEVQFVKLSITSGYFSQEAPVNVEGASVTINDGQTTFQLKENPNNPGLYQPLDSIGTEAGTTYKLTIDLKEEIDNETHFESEATMPPFTAAIDSIRVIWKGVFNSWIIKLYAYEPPETNFYMFNAYKNDSIFLTDSLTRVTVSDDKLVNGIYLPGVYTLFLYKDELEIGDTVTMITSSITRDYYRFITEAQQEVQPKDPLFSGPPANVRSNITNGAVGYFAVYKSVPATNIINGSGIWD